jgi:hypothetical protein
MREKGFSIHHVECQLEDPEIINRSLIGEIVEEEGHSISVVV